MNPWCLLCGGDIWRGSPSGPYFHGTKTEPKDPGHTAIPASRENCRHRCCQRETGLHKSHLGVTPEDCEWCLALPTPADYAAERRP